MSVLSFSEGDLGTTVVVVLVSLTLKLVYPVLVTCTAILRVRMWNRQTRTTGGTSADELDLVQRTAKADIQKEARLPSLFVRRGQEK